MGACGWDVPVRKELFGLAAQESLLEDGLDRFAVVFCLTDFRYGFVISPHMARRSPSCLLKERREETGW